MRRGGWAIAVVGSALIACGAAAPPAPLPPPPRAVEIVDGVAIRPEVEADHVDYLQTHLERELLDDCVAFAEDVALPRFPDSSRVLERLALCLWRLGDRDAAAARAERVLSQRPNAFGMHWLLGEHYFAEDHERTARHFRWYLRYRPERLADDDAVALVKLGISCLQSGAPDEALAAFQQVRTQFSDNPRWVLNADNGLCAAHTLLERMDEAIAVCESIVAEPRHVDRRGSAWFNLASAYHRVGREDDARVAAAEFLRIRPDAQAKVRRLFGDPDPDASDEDDAASLDMR